MYLLTLLMHFKFSFMNFNCRNVRNEEIVREQSKLAVDLAVHPLRALPREEAQRPAPRVFKLTVGHEKGKRRVLELSQVKFLVK